VDGSCVPKDKDGKEIKPCKYIDYRNGGCFDCDEENTSYSFLYSKCVYCPKECADCNESGKCSTCARGYHLDQATGTCERCLVPGCENCYEDRKVCLKCPYGFYFSFLTKSCQLCHKSCATCTGPKKNDCSSCTYKFRQISYKYDEVPSPIIMKLNQRLRARHPELSNMPMLESIIFHPESDLKCAKECLSEKEIPKDAVIDPNPVYFGNSC
jgi:hypothetical protein